MNKVNLMGRLTAEPELRQTQSGIYSCRFTVAVTRPMKNKQTGEYESDFITCTAWRSTAEFISRNFHKGKLIAISGTLRTGKYQDKKYSDVTHYTTDVLADEAYFCGDKAERQSPSYPPIENETGIDPQTEDNGFISDFEDILSDGDVPF